MATVVVDPATREELHEAISHLATTAARMPDHWSDRKALIHERINILLDRLDAS